MKIKNLYQTVEDRTNPNYIKENAPFPCNKENAWLGNGYYFWDTFIENAHWWGKVGYKSNYVICRYECTFEKLNCFDLVGNTEQMLDFSNCIDFLKDKNLIDHKTTVARILEYLKEISEFNYDSIRVYGIASKSKKEDFRLKFNLSNPAYLAYKPTIQICLYHKDTIKLSKGIIEYPDEYNFVS